MSDLKEAAYTVFQIIAVLFTIAFLSRVARGASIYDGASCTYVGTGQTMDDNGVFHLSTQTRLGLDCKDVKFFRSGEEFVRSRLVLHGMPQGKKNPLEAPNPLPSPEKSIVGHPRST